MVWLEKVPEGRLLYEPAKSLSMLDNSNFKASLSSLLLQRDSAVPMHRQIHGQVRSLILAGTLLPGMKLQSTRTLAVELGCSRNTVLMAFEQLYAEGFLQAGERSAIHVARDLPRHLLVPAPAPVPVPSAGAAAFKPSRLGAALMQHERVDWQMLSEFSSGLPDHGSFPYELWTRLYRRVWTNPAPALMRNRDPLGYLPLRSALAAHLRASRGLHCSAEQIVITTGTSNSLDLISRLFLDPGEEVWVEEPGFLEARFVLMAAQAKLVPVAVDTEGLEVAAGVRAAPRARMAVVAPSHQFPLGSTMSLTRRLELLDWATRANAWVLEDDYDSEFRYGGPSVAALQALDRTGRVFYMGTFSKTILPNLRLAYIVVPAAVADFVAAGRARLHGHTSFQAQPVLAAFIEEGYLATHLRRMRKLYAGRQAALCRAVARHLDGWIDVAPDTLGIHLIGHFTEALRSRMDDVEASRRAATAGVVVHPLSRYYLQAPLRHGLVFGYAGMQEAVIERRIALLAQALLGAGGSQTLSAG